MILSNKTISPKGPTTSFSKASQDLTQQMELPDCQRIAGFNYFFLFPEHFKDFTFVFLIHNCRWTLDLGNSRSGAFYRWDMDLFSHLSKLKKETINLIIYHSLFSVLSLLFHFTFYMLLFVWLIWLMQFCSVQVQEEGNIGCGWYRLVFHPLHVSFTGQK